MTIKALISFAGIDFSMAPGEVSDLPEGTAEDLINAGYAVKENAKAGSKDAKEETDEIKPAEGGDNPKPVKRGTKRTQ